jgi:hypothetical protein
LVREEARLLRERQRNNIEIGDEDWANIEEKAEFRRGLKARTPGRCQYFPNEFRCIRALPGFQHFRILEQLTHLRSANGRTLANRALDPSFDNAEAILEQTEKVSLSQLSDALGLGLKFDKDDREYQGKRTLVGAKTDIALATALGDTWIKLPIEQRDDWTMRFLRRHWTMSESPPPWTTENEDTLTRDADAAFGSEALKRVDEIAGKALAEGDKFANISLKAARILAAAYADRLDYEQRLAQLRSAGAREPEVALYERLPYYGKVMPEQTVPAEGFAPKERTCADEQKYGRAANPDVHVVMNAIRRVVNEIIEMMGGVLPTTCVVEVARSALSEDEANKHSKRVRQREELRQTITAEIEKVCGGLGKRMPRGPGLDRRVDRWKAAIRQGWRDYDGSSIAPSLLLDGSEYQLDHVSPAAFGEFRENNLFVTRFNKRKGRALPWHAFGKDGKFAPALISFATFGLEQTITGLEAILKPKPPRQAPKGKHKERLESALRRAEADLKKLQDEEKWEKSWGNFTAPRPDVLSALRGTLSSKLDSLVSGEIESDEHQTRSSPKAFEPRDQTILFRRCHPSTQPPEREFAARDVANIGWSTKLARQYLRHLGAEVEAIKPWAVNVLRCMFNIRKSDMRHDLRNHAVDAFLVAHFDARVLRPAFDRLRGKYAFESLYDLRVLDAAVSEIEAGQGFLDQLKNNIERLEAILPTISTAHRADNRWNPDDPSGGSLAMFGGENVYSFRPTRAERELLTQIAAKFGRLPKNGLVMTSVELLSLMLPQNPDENDQKISDALRKEATAKYRSYIDGKATVTETNMQTALPISGQFGAFVDAKSKFAIVGASAEEKRRIVSVAEFTKMNSAQRAALFAEGQPVYRRGDTVVVDGEALVVTGLYQSGALKCFPVDLADHDQKLQRRPTVPARSKDPAIVRFASDVLGRRLHRLRKDPGGLKPVPYPLRGE